MFHVKSYRIGDSHAPLVDIETICASFLSMSATNVVAIPPLHRPGTGHPRRVSTQRPTADHVIPKIVHRTPKAPVL